MQGRLVLAAMILVTCAESARAQRVEVQPFVGARFGGGFTVDEPIPGGTRPVDLNIESGLAWGLTVGVDVTESAGVEFMWSRQESSMSAESAAVPKTKLFDASVAQYHGNMLVYFSDRDVKTRPYFLVGFGATNFDPAQEGVDGATKFSFGLGAGVKVNFSPRLGARAQFRWTPTYVSTSNELFCDAFGFCYVIGVADYLNQGEVTGGITFRF
jgi:opacity protein-like surface antigen